MALVVFTHLRPIHGMNTYTHIIGLHIPSFVQLCFLPLRFPSLLIFKRFQLYKHLEETIYTVHTWSLFCSVHPSGWLCLCSTLIFLFLYNEGHGRSPEQRQCRTPWGGRIGTFYINNYYVLLWTTHITHSLVVRIALYDVTATSDHKSSSVKYKT